MLNLDWEEGKPIHPLLTSIETQIGPRRTRLLAVAFCDRIAHLLPDDVSRGWVDVARRYADRQARRVEVAAAHAAAERAYDRACFRWKTVRDRTTSSSLRTVRWATHPTQRYYAQSVANDAAEAAHLAANVDTPDPEAFLEHHWAEGPGECGVQLRIVRDVLGRPDPLPASGAAAWRAWQRGQALKLARTIYEDRVFGELPVLADALEDAGCEEAALLDHLRLPGPHVRGCWALDLILGKP